MILPYSWKQYILPGACCMTFPLKGTNTQLYITLGLTQPHNLGDEAFPWELAVRTRGSPSWPTQLLYDLLTCWLMDRRKISQGLFLPLLFFRDRVGTICAGLGDPSPELDIVGAIRGLYLWEDPAHFRFEVSSGQFGLLTAVAVTKDEEQLADETSPPHLLLLLKEMGVGQISDPLRKPVLTSPEWNRRWERIRALSHDGAVQELSRPEPTAGLTKGDITGA
jgi:hypothetical protein